MNTDAIARGEAYIRRIRNTGKKAYAQRALERILNGSVVYDRHETRGCSYMAAQAVDTNLRKLLPR